LTKNKFIPVNTPLLNSPEKKNVLECLKTNQLTSGKFIKKFENSFAKFHTKKYGISVSNGTAALEVAIKSLDLKKGSEIIIPNFSIISTAISVIKNDLIPIYVDCELDTWNASPEKIISKFSRKTKAIIITHIYGLPVNMEKILKFAKKKNIFIIEDAAEVIGLKYKKNYCGSFGDISTFSFYANKHITSGEGGMILTDNKKIYQKCKSLKNLCFTDSYINRFQHTDTGWNYRMSNIHAAIGEGQFKNLNKVVKIKKKIGNIYFSALKDLKNIILQPNKLNYAENIYWVFGIVLKNKLKNKRNRIMKKLLKIGIETRPFFFPMNKQKILKKYRRFNNFKFPNSSYISKNGFYIPSGLGLKKNEINKVIFYLKKELN
jgi:perosamine synthetase